MATTRIAVPSGGAPARWPRVEGLGWMMLYVACALVFLRFFLNNQLHLPGALLTLAVAILAAAAEAVLLTRLTLNRLQARWTHDAAIYALDQATVGAELSSSHGVGPFSLEAWNPTTRRSDQVLRLKGLGSVPIRPSWSVRFPRRGVVRLPSLIARSDQPFGLLSAMREISAPEDVLVLPAIGSIKKGLHTRLRSYMETYPSATAEDGDDEIAQLPDYQRRDAPPSIHWRASARARTLLVAQRNALGGRQLALVIDCAADSIGPRLERLLCAAATLVIELSRDNWRLSLHGAFAPAGIRGRPERLLEALALAASDARPVSEVIPPGMPALVLCLGAPPPMYSEPRPLALALTEIEELVHIPSRVR